ncbi:sugar ABC transporter substrate-binding protein [Bacillus ginsengihumi]|uniref:Sugar ABC transporter substrate-binding protein n=1 Tax=Heyndrickxia ginsengihumi TaxID=363870 RepID=A0A6M0P6T7_9BACI|nr:substrate-binding domain-containing protein [Heyndrickxia ginsengihumi]NEY19995.1 sugar ABC transporter substrate-binding protein [Heyndrickxia ginsengihumi]
MSKKVNNSKIRGKMKALSIIFAVGAMSLGLAACGSQATSTTKHGNDSTFKERNKIIGYSTYDLKQPYWQDFEKGIEQAAKKEGYKVVVSDQKGSQETQVSGSMNLINQNISALIVSPVQPSALPATITAAHNAKIPIVIGDIGAEGKYDAYVLSDNKGGGASAAEYVNKKLGAKSGTKEIGVIELHPGSAVGEDRVNGFVDKIKKYSGFKIVGQLNGDDSVDGGFKVTQSLLAANPNISVIFAANDPEAEGAVQALKQAGRLEGKKRVEVIGFNGDAPALELIKKGEMTATIAQHPVDLGKKTVEISLDLLKGKKVEFTDSAKKVYNVPTTLVDSNNINEYLK